MYDFDPADFDDMYICQACGALCNDDQQAPEAQAAQVCDHCHQTQQAGGQVVAQAPASAVVFICSECGSQYDEIASHPDAQAAQICDHCHYDAHPEAYTWPEDLPEAEAAA